MTDIGKTLKEARKEKGLTLDDLQQTTKIQKRYLIAIEDDDFDALPGKFYVRAFIKQYAETVGLDPEELMAQLDENTDNEEKEAEETVTTRTEAVKREEATQSVPWYENVLRYLPTIIIVVIVVAILGTIYLFAWGDRNRNSNTQIENSDQRVSVSSESSSSSSSAKKNSSSSRKTSAKSSSSVKKSSSKKTTKKATSQKITSESTSGSNFVYSLENAPSSQKVALEVSSGSSAWSAVSANGTQVWQGTLGTSETSHTVELPTNTTTITINLGNSKATSIKVNGKKFNFLKENDTLTVRTITLNVNNTSSED